ncbi:MAG: mechanosensitive ion channel [Ilumatobacteraceae bacterium]
MVSAASVMVSAARLVTASADNGDVSIDQVVLSGIESSQWPVPGSSSSVLAPTIVVARVTAGPAAGDGLGFAPGLMISWLGPGRVPRRFQLRPFGTLGVRVGPLLGALGLGGLVIALALQALVENLVSGLFIQPGTTTPAELAEDHTGGPGRERPHDGAPHGRGCLRVHVPNGQVLKDPIVNSYQENPSDVRRSRSEWLTRPTSAERSNSPSTFSVE